MYPPHVRREALALIRSGLSYAEVARRLNVNRSTLREWHRDPSLVDKYAGTDDCVRCRPVPVPPEPQAAYSYLLGLYLGDGCLSYAGDPAKRVYALRIACTSSWPGLIDECVATLKAVRPGHSVHVFDRPGCKEVTARWKHWPCLFPQHGPGRKHERRIELAPWQTEITDHHPGAFLRGLFHSDGCRSLNRVERPAADGRRSYAYPRYAFSNESRDIMRLCQTHLDRVGVAWRMARPNMLSVARRDDVARLDLHVGPKR
jgi:hypothetical protein